jgi:polyribonucleotide nucleotidyltransferase
LSYDTTANINILSTPPPTTAATTESSSSVSSDVAAINAISAAITASSGTIPWYGPIAAVRVCLVPLLLSGDAIQTMISKNNKTTKKQPYTYKAVVNPDQATIAQSKVSVLVVVNAHGEVVSMQIQGEQVGEEEVEMVLERGIQEAGRLILPQLALVHSGSGASNTKQQKVELSGADAEASAVVHQLAGPRIATILSSTDTHDNPPSSSSLSTSTALYNAKLQLIEDLRRRGAWRTDFARTPGSGCVSPGDLDPAFTSAVHAELRKLIIHKGYRPPDGRGLGDVRRVSAQLNFLPAPHGSALVSCSSSMDAQALGVVTVGGRRDAALMISGSKPPPSVFGSTATTSYFTADTGSSSSSSDNNYSRLTTYVATSPISTPNASSSGGGNYRPNPREQLQQDADHAAFLQTALSPVLPCSTEFPFPMRVNVEILPSSLSSATILSLSSASNDATTIPPSYSCSSSLIGSASLALATAGVPIKSLVAATTISLVAIDEERRWWCGEKRIYPINDDNDDDDADADNSSKGISPTRYEMLTDMSSIESAVADVELKVAGTNLGLTAVQLNVKLAHGRGVGADVIKAALKRARKVHLDVLRDMEDALREQPNMKRPVVDYVYVHENALPAVIGVQGSKIQNLEDETGAKVWVDFKSPCEVEISSSSSNITTAASPSTPSTPTASSSSSSILVYAPSKAIFKAAKQGLLASSGDTLIEGGIYPAQVTMVKDFGAFVDVGRAQVRALLHISEISNERIRSVQDCLKVGQQLEVMALGRGSKGELRVSARKVVGGPSTKEEEDADGDVGEEGSSSKKITTV